MFVTLIRLYAYLLKNIFILNPIGKTPYIGKFQVVNMLIDSLDKLQLIVYI